MNKPTFNPARWLPYLAAIAQIAQFINAGFTLFNWRGVVTGVFLGALVSVSVAYAASQYSVSWPKERRIMAIVGLIMLMSFSPVVVGSAAYLDLPIKGAWAIILSAAWGILPDFSVALIGIIAGRGLTKPEPKSETSQPQDENKPDKKNKKQNKPGHKSFTDAQLLAELAKNPGASNAVLGKILGVTDEAIRQRRAKFTPADLGLIK